ncbi:Tyrosine kinase catalytic domain protein [Ceratobasidium sp. AG-Ba]|nr:Tyrosine kinase catalytic domain protein [Ceratobasidium sp. AG-Ba]
MSEPTTVAVRDLTGLVVAEAQPTYQGGFSDVYEGELTEGRVRTLWMVLSGQPGTRRTKVAVKMLRVCRSMDPIDIKRANQDLMDEISTWSQLDHFNILPMLGIAHKVHGRELPSLISPWCAKGNVHQYIRESHLKASDCLSLILQATSAIEYLHSRSPPIIHGDLKPDNFLLQYNFQLQLSDFGLSKISREEASSHVSKSIHLNARWMSPELFSEHHGDATRIPRRTLASDIWALGCTFYEIITSCTPFHNISDNNVAWSIYQGSIPVYPDDDPSEEFAHLRKTLWPHLQHCWTRDPETRPSIEELSRNLSHDILVRECCQFYGPIFEFEERSGSSFVHGFEISRPSMIGWFIADVLENKADLERDKNRVLELLVKSAIGYHSAFDTNSACIIHFRIGELFTSRAQYSRARAHLKLARGFFEDQGDYNSALRCYRALAEVTKDLNEKVHWYEAALSLCRTLGWTDQEAITVQALGNAIYERSELSNGEYKHELLSAARHWLTRALFLYTGQANLELQVQVRCELVLLELDFNNKIAAQTHASAAFQCACETGNRQFAEEVCYYLKSTEVLTEPMYNSFNFDLRIMTTEILENMLRSRSTKRIEDHLHSWVVLKCQPEPEQPYGYMHDFSGSFCLV